MAEAARRRGHAYQVLTDHSRSLAIARGLDVDRVEQQRRDHRGPQRAIRRGGGGRHRATRDAARGLPPPARLRARGPRRRRARLRGRPAGPLRPRRRVGPCRASADPGRADRPDPQRHPLPARRRHRPPIRPDDRRRDDLDLDWDVVYAEAARTGTVLEINGSPPSTGPRGRAGATRGRGRLPALDRFGRAQDRRARLPALGRQPGAPGVGPARRSSSTRAAACRSARVGRRQGRPHVSGPGTIAAMDERRGRRDLALAAVTIVGLSRLIEPPGVWFVAIFLLGAMLLGTLQVLGDETAARGRRRARRADRIADPAGGRGRRLRRAPSGSCRSGCGWRRPCWSPACIVDRTLALEARILAAHDDLGTEGRTAVLVTTLIVAFLGFTGVAATVPGGLVQPAREPAPRCRRRTSSRSPSGMRSSRSCSAIGRPRCGSRPCATRCALGRDVCRGHRHRRRGAPRDGDPAPDGARRC